MPDSAATEEKPIDFVPPTKRPGSIAGVYIADGRDFVTRPVEALDLAPDGIKGDLHAGFLLPANSRSPWHPRDVMIRNDRHLSLVSAEELAEIAMHLGIESVDPKAIGANVVVEGIKHFSMLPRGTRLRFPSGATLIITDQNAPCRIAGGSLARLHPGIPRLDFRFVEVATRLRGVVAAIEREGLIKSGDRFEARIPEQWIWSDR